MHNRSLPLRMSMNASCASICHIISHRNRQYRVARRRYTEVDFVNAFVIRKQNTVSIDRSQDRR